MIVIFKILQDNTFLAISKIFVSWTEPDQDVNTLGPVLCTCLKHKLQTLTWDVYMSICICDLWIDSLKFGWKFLWLTVHMLQYFGPSIYNGVQSNHHGWPVRVLPQSVCQFFEIVH